MTERNFDVAIIGAGIVGASIAYHLAGQASVLLLEGETAPGYHTTGRSAALFCETYGPPQVRGLTRASRPFFQQPPTDFSAVPLLRVRGTLQPGSLAQVAEVEALQRTLVAEGSRACLLDGPATRERVPILRASHAAIGLYDPDAHDIDVDALLQGFLKGARRQGLCLRTAARVERLQRDGSCWRIGLNNGEDYRARTVVNAAGAWVDAVAALAGVPPIGIQPRRRSLFTTVVPDALAIQDWPAVIDIAETWYFKPDAGLLLCSPANADLVPPHDVVPEELDIAIGIHQIEQATTLRITRPRSTWAGLRCFAPDGDPVCGFDNHAPDFFWAAALGGYGIQSAPACGRLCAALLLNQAPPADIADQGIEPGRLGPQRLR